MDLEKSSIKRLFLNFSIPAVTGMLVMALYGVVDGIFVGRGVGADALAALNLGYPIVNLGAGVSLMAGIGGATLMSIYSKNKKVQQRCFSYIITLNIIFYLSMLVIVFLLGDRLFRFMGSSEELIPLVRLYVYPTLIFLIFLMLGNSLNAVVRNDKAPVYAFFSMILGAISNIFLDWLFILVFRWGILGAVVASGIGQILTFLALVRYFYRIDVKYKYRFMKLKSNYIFKILSIGFSTFIMEFAVAIVTVLFNISFMKMTGKIGVSAFCIVGYIFYIFRMYFNGLGQGIQPIISHNYGRKMYDRVENTFSIGKKVSFISGALILLWALFFSSPLVRLFNEDIILVEKATRGLIFYCSCVIFVGLNFTTISYLQSKGHTKFANILSILRSTVFVMINLFILPKIFGESGIWLSLPVADVMTYFVGRLLIRNRG